MGLKLGANVRFPACLTIRWRGHEGQLRVDSGRCLSNRWMTLVAPFCDIRDDAAERRGRGWKPAIPDLCRR
jgi:hypothetical protein